MGVRVARRLTFLYIYTDSLESQAIQYSLGDPPVFECLKRDYEENLEGRKMSPLPTQAAVAEI